MLRHPRRSLAAAFGGAALLMAATSYVLIHAQDREAKTGADVSFEQVTSVLVRHCARCHLTDSPVPDASGALALDDLIASEDQSLDREADWRRVYSRVLVTRSMPPRGSGAAMPDDDRSVIRRWIDRRFARTAPAATDAGQPSLRRLTNDEYNRSIRDLFGVDLGVNSYLQHDNVSGGFANNVAVVFSTPERVQQYLQAAEFVSRTVLGLNDVLTLKRRTWTAPQILAENPNGQFLSAVGRRLGDVFDGVKRGQRTAHPPSLHLTSAPGSAGIANQALVLPQQARVTLHHDFPVSGRYTVQLTGASGRARESATASIQIDGLSGALSIDFAPDVRGLTTHRRDIHLPGGTRAIQVSVSSRQPVLLSSVEITGPFTATEGKKPATALACIEPAGATAADALDCARRTIRELAPKAFRKESIDDATLQALLRPFHHALERGSDFRTALSSSIQAILMDPRFLYRPEPAGSGSGRTDDFAFATRLSYFLWASLPDEDLRRLAAERRLVDSPTTIRTHVRRMLADSRADALVDAFAHGWLGYSHVAHHVVDAKVFPGFDEELRQAMLAETRLYLRAFFDENWRIGDLIDSDVLFVNERLARHYGIDHVVGPEFRRVSSPLEERRGLLTQGSVLIVTSGSSRTSVVKRGFWILDRILCESVGDPPVVPPLVLSAEVGRTLRQEMERHRADPGCAGCHRKMDPLGFSLENYDGVGAWRTLDNGSAIDASGVFPGPAGSSEFDGFKELRRLLRHDTRVPACVIRKLMTYGLGRRLTDADEATADEIAESTRSGGHRIHDVITEIVLSAPFRDHAHQP